MLPINEFVPDVLIFTVTFTAFAVGTILWKPRIWLHDFPDDIQAMAEPKTQEEKRLTTLLGTVFLILVFGAGVLLTWDVKSFLGANFSFFNAWLYAYALFFCVNLWDLVVLDWIGLTLVDPQKPPIAGTEGAAGWRNYRFHFYAFLKGCVMGVVYATIVGGIVTLLA